MRYMTINTCNLSSNLTILYNYACLSIDPSITSSTIVMSTYTSSAESAELNEVLVQWEHVVRKKTTFVVVARLLNKIVIRLLQGCCNLVT